MATKAEQFRSEQERINGKTRRKSRGAKKPKKIAAGRRGHTAAKATHAREETAPGKRPSRISTRGSANRAKGDTAFNLTEEKKTGSPEARARKSRAQRVKVRGKPQSA
jgi:hypothetical protein